MISLFLLAAGQSRMPVLILATVSLTSVGILLFRTSSNLETGSGLSAFLDLFTSLFGVAVFVLIADAYHLRIAPIAFVLSTVACGLISSALFRRRLK